MSHFPYSEINIVGFTAAVSTVCERLVPLAYHVNSETFFPFMFGESAARMSALYTKSEIEALIKDGTITLLPTAETAFPEAMIIYVTDILLDAAECQLPTIIKSENIKWQKLEQSEDYRAWAACCPSWVVDQVMNHWAQLLLQKSTDLLARFLITKEPNLREQAEHLTHIALFAATDQNLRASIFLHQGIALRYSNPKRLEMMFSLIFIREFPLWSRKMFETRVFRLLEDLHNKALHQEKPLNTKDDRSPPTEPRPRPVAISLHGIRTRGKWQKDLTSELGRVGVIHEPLDYGFFMAIRLLFRSQLNRQVQWFLEEYTHICDKHQNSRPSIIAHSLGTYLVGKAMLLYPEIKFDQIILAGSILPTSYRWSVRLSASQFSRVLNEIAQQDIIVKIAEYIIDDAGPSGVEGFNDTANGSVMQRRHSRHGHSGFFYGLNYRRNWVPFLTGNQPSEQLVEEQNSPNWKFRIVRWSAVSFLIVIGVLLTWLLLSRNIFQLSNNRNEQVKNPSSNKTTENQEFILDGRHTKMPTHVD